MTHRSIHVERIEAMLKQVLEPLRAVGPVDVIATHSRDGVHVVAIAGTTVLFRDTVPDRMSSRQVVDRLCRDYEGRIVGIAQSHRCQRYGTSGNVSSLLTRADLPELIAEAAAVHIS